MLCMSNHIGRQYCITYSTILWQKNFFIVWLRVTTQFYWSVRGQYFTVLPARYCPCLYSCGSHTINLVLQFLGSGNTGKYSVLDSRPQYRPSLRLGRYDRSWTEYFPVLPSQSCNNTYQNIIKFHSNCSGDSRVQRKWPHFGGVWCCLRQCSCVYIL